MYEWDTLTIYISNSNWIITKKGYIATCKMSTLSESSMNADERSTIPVEYNEFDQSTSLDEKQKKSNPKDNDCWKIILGSEYYDEDGNLVVEANDISTKSDPSYDILIPLERKKKKKRFPRQDSNRYLYF